MMHIKIVIAFITCCFLYESNAQCDSIATSVYGDPFIEEQGRCLTKSAFSEAIYVAGNRNDSTLLIKFDFNGKILWAKTIDVVPGAFEAPAGILEDADGMLAIFGTAGPYVMGGTVYGMRYDPVTHLVLWAKEYSHSPNDYCYGMTVKGQGGNYLVNNQATFFTGNYNNAELVEIDKMTGNVVPALAKNYNLNGTETLFEIIYHENFIYGVGRYKDAGAALQMRNTLVKLDPNNGDQLWVRLGHLPVNRSARLYGTDLVIAHNSIYSICLGDPAGQSITNTKVYIQRTDLDGNLIWVKQYELPGAADYSHDFIVSGNGFVALTFDDLTRDCYLFKIDTIGEVLWAKSFLIDAVTFPTQKDRANSQLIEAGNQLIFTGRDINATGDADLVLLRTDLNGDLQSPCIASQPMTLQAQVVSNPVFYAITPEEFLVDIDVTNQFPQIKEVFLSRSPVCVPDAVQTLIEVTICSGQQYESYSSSGIYQDTFLTIDGCDSIRILELTVEFFSVNETVQICQGTSFEGYDQPGEYIDTIQGTAGACDTIRQLTLEVFPPLLTFINADICSGQSFLGYSTTGIHTDTFTAIDGCDSVRIVDLTVSDTIIITIQAQVCFGEAFEGYLESGTYQDTFISVFGCDSTRILELTVLDEIVNNPLVEICLGDTYEGKSVPGYYIDTMQAISGCDSIIRLQLDVVPVEQEMFIELCPGQSYEQYNLPGIYVDTLPGITSPCDTIRKLKLSISLPIETSIVENICEGERYFGYTAPGTYSDTLSSMAGCDSIRTVALYLTESVESHVEADLCEGLFFGHSKPGTYIDTLISKAGCDSIRTVVLEGTTTYIPNIFSPNNDGINDLFKIISFPDNSLDLHYFGVFDRFGNMAYQTETWPVEWTGNDSKGRSFQPGVFTYILIYHCGQNQIIKHGTITLIK